MITATLEEAVATTSAAQVAAELGILEGITGAGATSTQISTRFDLAPRMVDLLLEALCAAGVVERAGDGFRSTVTPADLTLLHQLWSGLRDAVRDGRPVIDVTQPEVAAATYRVVSPRISGRTAPLEPVVAAALTGNGPRVLDLGAGAAGWTRTMAHADPSLTVTAVELPGVADITRQHVVGDGLGDRFRVVEGDLFRVDVGTDFDLVLLAGVCRLFGAATNAGLVRRVASLARPGGRVAIIDTLPDADRGDDGSVALYALGLGLRTSTGGIHALSAYASWLYDAGFSGIELVELGVPHLSLIRATRPV